MSDKEDKPKWKFAEVPDIPPTHPGNSIYNEPIAEIQKATENTMTLQLGDKGPKQIYSVLHNRIVKHNQKPDRQYDLQLAQRKDVTYLKRLPKDSLVQKK
jgi:hypothetical protein